MAICYLLNCRLALSVDLRDYSNSFPILVSPGYQSRTVYTIDAPCGELNLGTKGQQQCWRGSRMHEHRHAIAEVWSRAAGGGTVSGTNIGRQLLMSVSDGSVGHSHPSCAYKMIVYGPSDQNQP
jgi:hypothetical protein